MWHLGSHSRYAKSSESTESASSPGIKQTVSIIDWVDGSAVEGVELCWAVNGGEKSCLTTGKDGTAVGTADVSAGDSLVLSGSKSGFYPFQTTYVIPENPGDAEVSWSLVADSIVDLLVGELGEAADATKGHNGGNGKEYLRELGI